jgi:acetyl-CoA carboxylase carboxyl transferase subunit alpha
MKVSSADLLRLGVIDRIVPEPVGGAHRDHAAASQALGDALVEELDQLRALSPDERRRKREERFLLLGQ